MDYLGRLRINERGTSLTHLLNVSLLSEELPDFTYHYCPHSFLLSFSSLSFPPASVTVSLSPWSAFLSLQRLGSYFAFHLLHLHFPTSFPPMMSPFHLLILSADCCWIRGDLTHHFHFVVLIRCLMNS